MLTRRQLDELAGVELAAREGEMIRQPPDYQGYPSRLFNREAPYALQEAINLPGIAILDWQARRDDRIRRYTEMAAFRRAVRLCLLLEAWKLRHGKLPGDLNELVGPDLDRVPIDPFTGTHFGYFPEGLIIPLHWHQALDHNFRGVIEEKTPFVWSAGERVRYGSSKYYDIGHDAYWKYMIPDDFYGGNRVWREPSSDYDVWEAGWPFVVP
jgi:hypothetical protein